MKPETKQLMGQMNAEYELMQGDEDVDYIRKEQIIADVADKYLDHIGSPIAYDDTCAIYQVKSTGDFINCWYRFNNGKIIELGFDDQTEWWERLDLEEEV